MNLRNPLASLLVASSLMSAIPTAQAAISWTELQALPMPPPVTRINYGAAAQQFGELRLPAGIAPKKGWPVAVMIHGGCWQAAYSLDYFTRLSAALADAGIATWTIEYRRIGDVEGGWPNTFLDVAAATDYLRELAKKQPIDLNRVVASGHSAGGHLALWLAARKQLFGTSMIYTPKPLAIKGVVGLAAIADLKTYRVGPPDSCNSSVDRLMGGTPGEKPGRYAEASPMALLPLGVRQWLVSGEQDNIVPLAGVRAYATAAKKAGDTVILLTDPTAGHFDVAAPSSPIALQAIAVIKLAVEAAH